MKKVLLDTSVLINREAPNQIEKETGELFKLLDHFKYQVFIHPLTHGEIEKYEGEHKEFFKIKMSSYLLLPEKAPEAESIRLMKANEHEKHHIDSDLLNEVVQGAVDYLIAEDPHMNEKRGPLGISDRVFNTSEFLRVILRPKFEKEESYFRDNERVIHNEFSYQYWRSTPLVYLHAYLPTESSKNSITCLIDIKGLNWNKITFSNKEIVSVLFSGIGSPYDEIFRKWIVGEDTSNSYIIQLGNLRFSFPIKILNDLCNVIDSFYLEFMNCISQNDFLTQSPDNYSRDGDFELLKICRDLQDFFSIHQYKYYIYIDSKLIRQVFLALKCLFESCQNLDKVYLISNLGVSRYRGSDISGLLEHMVLEEHRPNNIALLDFTLRCFIALVEDNKKILNPDVCYKVIELLNPVVNKVNRTRTHLSYLKMLNE